MQSYITHLKDVTVCYRFTLETSPTSGFALWIYAVPTSSNSTRLIISAGLSPKGFAQGKAKPKSQNPIQFLKSAGLRLFTSLQPRSEPCSASMFAGQLDDML